MILDNILALCMCFTFSLMMSFIVCKELKEVEKGKVLTRIEKKGIILQICLMILIQFVMYGIIYVYLI